MKESITVPGRVNLIGGHTDYNGGLALPIAINQAVTVTGELSDEFSIDAPEGDDQTKFYVHNTLEALPFDVPPLHFEITGDLPVGMGLSSSAALCIGVAGVAISVARYPLTTEDLVETVQLAEEATTGTRPGKLDPLAILKAPRNGGLLIEFDDMTYQDIPFGADFEIGLIDSGVNSYISDGGYSQRKDEVENAHKAAGDYPTPSHIPMDEITDLDGDNHRRISHIHQENMRVGGGARALATGEMENFGEMLNDSYWSLSNYYDATTPELDELVEDIQSHSNVRGARVTGKGWGGTIVVIGNDLNELNREVLMVDSVGGLLR